MTIFYTIGIFLYQFTAKVFALFNHKARLMVNGHKNTFRLPESWKKDNRPCIHFHAASLGEFEQARPIIENLRKQNVDCKILLSFFSPSGYEVRKNYNLVDYVCYLPFDTPRNAKRFTKVFNPKVSVFVKYEFWYHYSQALKSNDTVLLSASSIFREDQYIFKAIGQKTLKNFDHFFVQNELSKKLLNEIGITSVQVTGDSRYDAVISTACSVKEFPEIEAFIDNQKCIVIGSSWPEDLDTIAKTLNDSNWKVIIAPHKIGAEDLDATERFFPRSVRYSRISEYINHNALIIDNFGMLTSVYKLADVSYVGGGFKTGLHNILEPAVFGSPIIIGPKYDKFQEVTNLIELGTCFSVNSQESFKSKFLKLQEESYRNEINSKNKEFISRQTGASDTVSNHIIEQL